VSQGWAGPIRTATEWEHGGCHGPGDVGHRGPTLQPLSEFA